MNLKPHLNKKSSHFLSFKIKSYPKIYQLNYQNRDHVTEMNKNRKIIPSLLHFQHTHKSTKRFEFESFAIRSTS